MFRSSEGRQWAHCRLFRALQQTTAIGWRAAIQYSDSQEYPVSMLKSLLTVFLLVITPLTLAETFHGNVVGITDGDTVTLLVDRTQIKVRL